MTFPVRWGRKCSLTIQASGIDSDLTDFSVLLTEDTLPLEMFDADGDYSALNDGGDIRFSFDSDGSIQLACEVVTFSTDNDPNNGKAEIWVKVPFVSSSENTAIYVWYNKVGENQPVSNDTYGSENVWDSNFKMVQHMNEDPSGTAPQELDSTTNDNGGTSNGSMTSGDLVDAKVGRGLDFDGSDDYITLVASNVLIQCINFTIEVWIKVSTIDSPDLDGRILDIHRSEEGSQIILCCGNSDQLQFWEYGTTNNIQSINIGQWYNVVITYDGTTYKFYVDGKTPTEITDSLYTADTTPATLGGYYNSTDGASFLFNGIIDEVRISNTDRSAAWISACYSNQNDPSTFVIEETPEYVGLYYFSGYVFEQNNPVSRKLYLHNRSTSGLIGTTMSSGNGYYYMETIFSGSHYVVCLDDAVGVDYNDLIIGPAFPTMVSG